jgi:GntR family transcriptional regulator/MocR family aminotransferase
MSDATKREALLDAVRKHTGDRAEVTGDGAGAHIVLWPRAPIAEEAVVAHAAARGVAIYGISRYFMTQPSRPGLLLGYARLREADIREGVRRLRDVVVNGMRRRQGRGAAPLLSRRPGSIRT